MARRAKKRTTRRPAGRPVKATPPPVTDQPAMEAEHEEDYWNPEEPAGEPAGEPVEAPVEETKEPVEEPVEETREPADEPEPVEPEAPAHDEGRAPGETQPVEVDAETAEPEPVDAEAEAVEPEPEAVEPEAEAIEPEPEAAEPEAEAAEPEPEAADAEVEPEEAEPEPEAADAEVEPEEAEPEPEKVEPTPVKGHAEPEGVEPEPVDTAGEAQPAHPASTTALSGEPAAQEAAAEEPATEAPGQDHVEPAETQPVGLEPVETQPQAAGAVAASAVAAATPATAGVARGQGTAPRAAGAHPTGTDFDEFAAAAGERDAGESHPVEGKAAWSRLLKMSRPRASRGNLLVALLAVLLGAGIAAQVQLTNQRGLDELSQTDLVRVLDDVSLRASRLDSQVRELEATRDRLKSGTGTNAEALEQAQKRVDTLGILAGTIAAKGPGITLRISDPDNQVTAPIVLDIIQELRDAGAESIDVGGVRVVASSFVGDRDGEIVVEGKTVSRPLVITVIGDSKTLSSAMTIPGGIVETVRQKGANASIAESDLVEITSIHTPSPLKNAKPVE